LGLDQLAPPMRPAEGQSQRIASRALWRGQMGISAIGIDLDRAVEAVQDFGGIFAFAPGSVMEHDPRWGAAVPAAIITQHRPEIPGLGLATPRVEDRGGGLIHIEPRAVG